MSLSALFACYKGTGTLRCRCSQCHCEWRWQLSSWCRSHCWIHRLYCAAAGLTGSVHHHRHLFMEVSHWKEVAMLCTILQALICPWVQHANSEIRNLTPTYRPNMHVFLLAKLCSVCAVIRLSYTNLQQVVNSFSVGVDVGRSQYWAQCWRRLKSTFRGRVLLPRYMSIKVDTHS